MKTHIVHEIRRVRRLNGKPNPVSKLKSNGDGTVHLETACGHRINLRAGELMRAAMACAFDWADR